MPVLKHYKGNCHVYVEKTADLDMAERIVVNAKCQRPGVCNAAESLLIDAAIAETFLPRLAAALQAQRRRAARLSGDVPAGARARSRRPRRITPTEYLDLILSVKVVAGLEEAIAHINRYGSQHTDAIVTNDLDGGAAFHGGGGFRGGAGQRQHALQRRLRTRPRRGNRHQHG